MSEERRADLMIVGPVDAAHDVEPALQHFEGLIRAYGSMDEAARDVQDETVGLVLVGTPSELASMLIEAQGSPQVAPLPRFAVARHGVADNEARRLLEEGADEVFAWPEEVLFIERVIEAELDDEDFPARQHSIDRRIGHGLRFRLEAADEDFDDVDVTVQQGTARLMGRVDSQWLAHRLGDVVRQVPGVEAIDGRLLNVRAPVKLESELVDDIREVLISACHFDTSSIRIHVEGRRVRLGGSVDSGEQRRRIETLTCNVEGVEFVDNRLSVGGSGATSFESDVSLRLIERVRRAFPHADIRVQMERGTARIRGSVPSLAVREAVVSLIANNPGVDRVHDEITVGSNEGK